MSLHKLSDINNLDDPLKQFLCKFIIQVPPRSPFSSEFAQQMELRAQSFSFPKITGDTTKVEWGGHAREYAGKQTRSGDWNVTFTEVWSGNVLEGFKKWVNNYHNYKEGTISLFKEYATTINVQLLDPNLYDAQSEARGASAKDITLYRAYPTSVSTSGSINPNSSEPINIEVTLHYDYFLISDENN